VAEYIPEAGDVVWLQFDPRAGHEQAGHRPALVLTPRRYNALRGMMVCCPMTSRIRGYVFEVIVSRTPPSVVLADQLKSLDWRARGARFSSAAPPDVLAEVQGKVKALLGLQAS
jgi:mRNA interferase MazF